MQDSSRGADPDTEPVVDAVLGASRALVAVAARSIAAVDGGVTLPQYRTLVVLASRGPQNVGALADELGVHSSTVTRMCDRLVRRGLIERAVSATSRREVTIALTRAGRDLLDRVTTVRRHALGEIVGRVPPGLRADMVAALRAFSAAAGEVPDQAWAVGWEAP
jgi:DNA-binding MarR family transcriptional regulator